MKDQERQEEKNKRIGWLTSLAVQLLLLVLFYFIIAWREPFPPLPEYGIELGFTTSSGASAAPAPSQPLENPEPQEETTVEEVQEVTEVTENVTEEMVPIEQVTTQEVEDVPIVEEEKSQQKEEKPEEKVDERALMKPTETSGEGQSEAEGEEDETIDERAIYGSQGSNTGNNEGASLALSGWIWDFQPRPNDTSDQSGKIVYKIVVDQDGYLVKIETVTSTVSPAVERKYREAVQKLTFSKTTDYKVAPLSTGTITFIIKSR